MILPGRCAAIIACLTLSIGSWVAPAYSQATYPFDVTAPTISSPAAIDAWVDAQVKEIASGDRDKVVAARQALMLPGSNDKKSAAFLAAYSKAIGTKLLPVASGADAHAKLNAGIVAGKVADMGGTSDLSPLMVKLISDDSAPVALYGIRASSSLIPRVLGDRNLAPTDKIVPAIAAALAKHLDSEAIVTEAYQSLIRVINVPAAAQQLPQATITAATPKIIEGLLDLLSVRSSKFGKGETEIVEPMAESPAIVFLAKQTSWAAMNQAAQTRTVKTLLDIASGAASELQLEFDKKSPSRPRIVALQRLLKESIGQALGVIGSYVNDPALTAEADKLKPLNTLSAPAQWTQTINGIRDLYSKSFKIQASTSNPASSPSAPAN